MTHNSITSPIGGGPVGPGRLCAARGLATALAAYVAALAIGCAAEPIPLYEKTLMTPRFLRYTMRGVQSGFYTQTWRSNYLSQPAAFKPGSKVEFELLGDTRVDMRIDGLPAKMFSKDAKFPATVDEMKKFLDKHFAPTKEELKLNAIEPGLRSLIDAGSAATGSMTKEQVFMAIGPPSHIDNYIIAAELPLARIMESNQWVYRWNEIMMFSTYHVYQFNAEGKLGNVIR
jgi:hypothetical protein